MKILAFLVFSILVTSSALAFQDRGEMRVHGVALIKDAENDDMWDKKNEATSDAKEKATIALVKRVLSQEEFVTHEEKIRETIVPLSNRFLLGSEVVRHGAIGKTYTSEMLFKYSMKNLKTVLNNEGIFFNEIREPKVASFVEVIDYTKIKTHRWWASQGPEIQVHKALLPLRREMVLGMKDQGFKLLPPMKISDAKSLKASAIAQGAHYYIKGKLKVEDNPRGFEVKDGEFYIYEAFSQKLVATLNLKELQKKLMQQNSVATRGPASVENSRPNVIRQSFKEAALKMTTSGANQNLNSGITFIKVKGITQPQQISAVKTSLSKKLGKTIGTIVERRIERGAIEFSVRTSSPTNVLVSMINRASFTPDELVLQKAELMANGRGLVVQIR